MMQRWADYVDNLRKNASCSSEGMLTGAVDNHTGFPYTAPEDDLYRIISARFATSSERDDYEQNLFHS
jgi:uncharacterized DUF497 family protein